MSEFLGKVHFWGSLVFINVLFFPMFLQGMAGMHRRWWDGGLVYSGTVAEKYLNMNETVSFGAWMLGLFQLVFVFNFFYSIFRGKKVPNDNPWNATTVEWDTPTPPPHGNFIKPIVVYRGAYEYSVPGAEKDFTPQTEPPAGTPPPAPAH